MASPDRRAVIAVLQRHGLPSAGAEGLRSVGVNLRGKTLLAKREFGAAVEAATGLQFGQQVAGSAGRVEMGPLLRAMVGERRYGCVHTHPEGYAFSPNDAAVLVSFRAVVLIAVVGGQGTWYVLSVDPDREPPLTHVLFETFRQEREILAAKYESLVRSGELTRREALREHTHEVWERIAPSLGLRYDRVQ